MSEHIINVRRLKIDKNNFGKAFPKRFPILFIEVIKMTTTNEMIDIMKAYAAGENIEFKTKGELDDAWRDTTTPLWDWTHNDYRVKKEPKYRPYKDIDEMLEDCCIKFGSKCFHKSIHPFIWVKEKGKENGLSCLITGFDKEGVIVKGDYCSLDYLFNNYFYDDYTEIGKLK